MLLRLTSFSFFGIFCIDQKVDYQYFVNNQYLNEAVLVGAFLM